MGDGWFPFPRRRGWPSIALDAPVQVIIAVDVSNEFVLQHTHHDLIGAGEVACPSEQLGTVNAVSFHRPTAHQ